MDSGSKSPYEQKVALEESINFRELLNGGDVTFSVKDTGEKEEVYQSAEDVFDREALLNNVNLETLSIEGDHVGMPFESIKERMTNVTPNGSVMKKVLKEGIGNVIPQHALVCIHYAGYFEFNEVPFDSTYLRGKSFEFVLGNSNVVPGLDIAVATMRNQEKAEFLVQPSQAFGTLGCPPRIPGDAEVLFIVQVMRWKVGSEAAVACAGTNAAGEKGWEQCKAAFKALNHDGISFYKEKKYQDSKMRLERAKKIIENCHLKDEQEERDHQTCMYRVSLNLSMAYNKLQGSLKYAPLAIINAKEALRITPDSAKAELQWGLALISLGEYNRAKEHLLVARKRMPDSMEVMEALGKLESRKKQEKEVEGAMWKRVFSPHDDKPAEEKDADLSPEARQVFQQLKEFCSSSQKMLTLPAMMAPKENEMIRSLAEKLNLSFNVRNKSICISKK